MLNNFYIFSTCSETTFCLNPVESNILYWFTEEHIKYNCNLIQFSKENWIEGGGDKQTWNDKQTSGISCVLDEDSPYTNLCLFTLYRLPFVIVVTQKLVLQQSKNVTAKCTETLSPLLLFNSPCNFQWFCCLKNEKKSVEHIFSNRFSTMLLP